MKVKEKKCKGLGHATNSGCGKEVLKRTYGLCDSCYYHWLTTTEPGRVKLEKATLKGKAIEKKKRDAQKKVEKEKLKTHKDYLRDFEKVFNEFIRKRDKGQPCISCQKPYGEFTESAGHYFPAGSNGSIRFDEDNVHLQCWYFCNKNRHGNQVEYLPNLIKKIGQQRFDELCERRNTSLKLSIPEIKEKIKYYKSKIKSLCQHTTHP